LSYEFYNEWRTVSSASPSHQYREDLQATINEQFENASDIYTIEEENIRGTMIFSNVEVRICHVLSDKQTGEKLGDDYRELIFKSMEHDVFVGKRFRFDNNIFICINTDNYHYVTKSCIIRRCNNSFRWIDEFGNKIQEPCICNYKINDNSNTNNPNITIPDGEIDNIIMQYNQYSKTIIPNQRFLIGNPRVCYKVKGNGINNYMNQNTFDDNSVQLTKLDVMYDQINISTDDIVLGYANAYENTYTIEINQGDILEQVVGHTSTLSATVKKNGEIVNESIVWSTNDEDIVTVDSNGNIELIAEGTATITATLQNNSDVSADIQISVISVPVGIVKINIAPQTTSIKQGSSVEYTVNKTIDNVESGEVLIIQDITTNIPSGYYTLTINSNRFTVKNLKMNQSYPVKIKVSDNSDNSNEIDITLKGAW
jgi:hypothetical protein